MHPIIRFHSAAFDLSKEPDNPINPIRGQSLLAWIRERVPDRDAITEPDVEDWGWYCDLDWGERSYLLGACAHESADGMHEWVIFVDKHRTMFERLLGRAKMTADDACLRFVHELLRAEPAFVGVALEFE